MQKFGKGEKQIVFLHGGGIRYRAYLPLINELAEDSTVYAFDLPGHGFAGTSGNVDEAIDAIVKEITSLNLNKCILIGHSFGGFCAYRSAEILTNVTDLILIDPLLTKVQDTRISLINKFFFKKNLRGLYLQPSLIKFFFNANYDILSNIWIKKKNSLNTIRLLIRSSYTDKNIDLKKLKDANLKIVFGDKDSIINSNDLAETLKSKTIYVNGEHDWCMADVKKTKKLIDGWIGVTDNI